MDTINKNYLYFPSRGEIKNKKTKKIFSIFAVQENNRGRGAI